MADSANLPARLARASVRLGSFRGSIHSMPRISVLIPTHEHAATLPYAVRNVQTQGVEDLEILICGDGVSDQLRAVITELQQAEPRIRFFDLPKAPRIGEFNRDYVLRQAAGRIVCIHNDDDLWLPGHIEVLERALEDADFVGAMQVTVGTDGKARAHYFDLERPEFVEPWLDWKPNNFGAWACNGFGPIFVAHRLDAYLRLPEGWATTPAGLPTDQTMWHKFLRQPWCRAKFLRWPIALHFPSSDRRDWTPEKRAEELRQWTEIIASQDYAVRIWRDLMPDLGDRLLSQSLKERGPRLEAAEERVRQLEGRIDGERKAAVARIRELENQVDALTAAASAQVTELQTRADAERSAMTDRIRQLERVLTAEKAASIARIRELENQVDAITAGASAQVTELQTRAGAERAAAIARIRELESQVDAVTAGASAQVIELEMRAGAERSAATDRIRELERVLTAEKAAAVARIRDLENQVDAIMAAAAAQVIELQASAGADRSAAAGRIRELEKVVAANEAALARERRLRAKAESERDAVLSSTFWWFTAPLRQAVDRLRRVTFG